MFGVLVFGDESVVSIIVGEEVECVVDSFFFVD